MMLTPEQLANLRQAAKGGWKVELDGRGIREIVAHIDAQQARIAGLEMALFAENQKRKEVEQQRGQLLAALKACDEAMGHMSEYDIPITLPETVRDAIAAVPAEAQEPEDQAHAPRHRKADRPPT